jgi:RNA polymerase sigma-70 factor (ECF subfamily)
MGNKSLAEDAFQEVFIRVYQRRDQLREAKALKSWLLLIARSVCLNMTRESVFTPEFVHLDDEHREPVGYSHRRELSVEGIDQEYPEEIFQHAFNKIAPIYRDAFMLREIEGFTCEEVAELTGTTSVNVKVRVLRAKKMLREILAPHFKHRLETIEKKSPPQVRQEIDMTGETLQHEDKKITLIA